MDFYAQKYTLEDILGLTREKVITCRECAEVLEEELILRHPSFRDIVQTYFERLRRKTPTLLGYCDKLTNMGFYLELQEKQGRDSSYQHLQLPHLSHDSKRTSPEYKN